MNFGDYENVLNRGVGGNVGSNGELERMSSEPEAPGFFDSSVSNKRMNYMQWQNLKAETMKRNLLYELDRANNPMSIQDVSHITGQPLDALATEAQRTVPQYGPSRIEQYKEEGPRPMGMKSTQREVGMAPGEPEFTGDTPYSLFSEEERSANPLMTRGMEQDFMDKKAPYYKEGQPTPMYDEVLTPTTLQGPGAPITKERTVQDIVGHSPRATADALPWQRSMAEAKIHQMGLRPLMGSSGKPSAIKEKYDMLVSHGVDPDEAALLVGGLTNQERLDRQTTGNLGLMGAKQENLNEQTRTSKEMFRTKKELFGNQSRLAAARADDIKDMNPTKKGLMSQQTETSKALEQYYQHRMDGRDVELSLRESKLLQVANEQDRKWIQTQIQYAKANKENMTDEQFDGLIDAIGNNLLIKGDVTKAPLTDRLMNMFKSDDEKEPISAGLPNHPELSGGTSRSGKAKVSNVPSADAGETLKALADEMGDLTKLEGKTVRDSKTGKRYSVTGGKLNEVK